MVEGVQQGLVLVGTFFNTRACVPCMCASLPSTLPRVKGRVPVRAEHELK